MNSPPPKLDYESREKPPEPDPPHQPERRKNIFIVISIIMVLRLLFQALGWL